MTPSRIWVDTSFLYALFVRADKNHLAANRVWKEKIAEKCDFLTSNLAVCELGTLLAYRFGPPVALRQVSLLYDSALLQMIYADEKCSLGALAWWRKYPEQKFSYTDCVSFQFMRILGLSEALSYDRDFTVAGFQRSH